VGPDLLLGIDDSEGPPTAEEIAGFERELRGTKARHKMVFLHRPTVEGDRVRDKYRALDDALRRGGVDVVFAGHRHYYADAEVEGVHYVTNGMGGDKSGFGPAEAFLTLVNVDRHGIEAVKVSLGRRSELSSSFRDSLVGHLYWPWVDTPAWWVGVLAVFVIAVAAGSAAIGRPAILIAAALTAPALSLPPPDPRVPALVAGFLLLLGITLLPRLRRIFRPRPFATALAGVGAAWGIVFWISGGWLEAAFAAVFFVFSAAWGFLVGGKA
jgi:hypothetical protein